MPVYVVAETADEQIELVNAHIGHHVSFEWGLHLEGTLVLATNSERDIGSHQVELSRKNSDSFPGLWSCGVNTVLRQKNPDDSPRIVPGITCLDCSSGTDDVLDKTNKREQLVNEVYLHLFDRAPTGMLPNPVQIRMVIASIEALAKKAADE